MRLYYHWKVWSHVNQYAEYQCYTGNLYGFKVCLFALEILPIRMARQWLGQQKLWQPRRLKSMQHARPDKFWSFACDVFDF